MRFPGERQRVIDGLAERGVGTLIYYPVPIHRQAYLQEYLPGAADLPLPVTDRLSDEVLAIPVHPRLSQADLETIVDADPRGCHAGCGPTGRAGPAPMSTRAPLRIALAGLGSMGRNHLRVIAAHPGDAARRGRRSRPRDARRRDRPDRRRRLERPTGNGPRGGDRRARHRRPDHRPRPAGAGRDRAGDPGPRREAARRHAGRGARDRARRACPGRPRPGRPRRALQPRRPRARATAGGALADHRLLDRQPPRRARFPPASATWG